MALRTVLLTVANLLIPVAILIFATGFFPYKPFMPGLAEYEKLGWEQAMGWKEESVPEAPFDKLVFMVVDALRSDFVFGEDSGMSFVQSLIREGTALPFTAHAASPTITMPKVKAMTTGSIPSFLDVILNFAESDTTSTLSTQDTWLAQLRAKQGGKLVMYGDDTWLKLFPGFFERADGTSSFFVSDFTEVDNNVTRHVPEELLNSDWNAMIMHYLGLDHIGHKAGPKSPNMLPKQKEMDGIVRDIYSAIENEDHLSKTLFVLCGDHGMNEGGNHGGSAAGETSPALVFMSPKLKDISQHMEKVSPTKPKDKGGEFEYYRMVEQSDIAPTLAGLLGFPVPRNNLGVFIKEFLSFWPHAADRIRLLLRNARQMKMIVEATYPNLSFEDESKAAGNECEPPLSDGQDLACKWHGVVDTMSTTSRHLTAEHRIDQLFWFLTAAQEKMSSTASNYDVPRLIIGTVLTFVSVLVTLFTLPSLRRITPPGVAYTLTIILYSVLMFASSYVEEEHNFWYWATSGWFFCLFISKSRKEWQSKFVFHPAIMLLVTHRIIRRWNQTGQKYAGADDIVHSGIFHGNTSFILWALVGATYMDITIRISRHVARSILVFDKGSSSEDSQAVDANRFMGVIAVLPLGATAFVFKLAFTARDAPELTYGINQGLIQWVEDLSLVDVARMVFAGTALSAVWITISEWKRNRDRRGEGSGDLAIALFDLLSLFLITQTKAQNIPLYLLFRFQFFFLSLLDLTPAAITTTTLLLIQTSFFALGNSNAISSIDLSNAYNGVSGYNVIAVGLLLFLSNWAGPIYFTAASSLLLSSPGRPRRNIAMNEVDSRDWVQKEREHLERMAKSEEEGRKRRESSEVWGRHVGLMTLWVGVATGSVMVACTVLRTHLFIWTVFSPKYLYAMAWGIAFHFGGTLGLGSLVWRAGRW
ncbi:major facilitator super transporter protein [Didymosphaeria variabile]|uniref:GPI ethanolamine phosphate transferase 2 n=1 Tax=Didymosphaeria variabile TaxID=1932322 RepID=A0A9W8XLY3_9PLEO|nr:major facilitator super transporter protein [Didymosphaeria variabile]KAJ4354026.1 major facilitator super transporter protein [Didymosphaeria variabile]